MRKINRISSSNTEDLEVVDEEGAVARRWALCWCDSIEVEALKSASLWKARRRRVF